MLNSLIYDLSPRVFFSVLCGGLIGLERELKNKRAGIKTNMLICLGACLYTTVGVLLSSQLDEYSHYGDPARVSAQIVSGIGFLGGGVIYMHKGTIVRGLTTAAIIWTVAAIGVFIGLGRYTAAVFVSLAVVNILTIVNWLDRWTSGNEILFSFSVQVEKDTHDFRHQLNLLLKDFDLELEGFQVGQPENNTVSYSIQYRTHTELHNRLILKLWLIDGVGAVVSD